MYRLGYYRYIETGFLPITLLKEFVYCPRLAYLELFTGYSYITDSMKRGKEITYNYVESIAKNVKNIKVQHYVRSRSLKLHGLVDLVGEVRGRLVVYEFKPLTTLSRKSLLSRHKHFLVQAAAYAVATEETFKRPVIEINVVGMDKVVTVKLTPFLRCIVKGYSNRLHEMVKNESEPLLIKTYKCNYCKMRKLCFI